MRKTGLIVKTKKVIIFHKSFYKDCEKLPKKIQEKFSNRLKLFKDDKNITKRIHLSSNKIYLF